MVKNQAALLRLLLGLFFCKMLTPNNASAWINWYSTPVWKMASMLGSSICFKACAPNAPSITADIPNNEALFILIIFSKIQKAT